MAINWYWKNKLGFIYSKEYDKSYKFNMYTCNGLACWFYEWKEEGKEKFTLQGFFADKTHLTNCLGLTGKHKGDNIYKNITKVKLNTYFKEAWIIAKEFVKVGIKVELYYKIIK